MKTLFGRGKIQTARSLCRISTGKESSFLIFCDFVVGSPSEIKYKRTEEVRELKTWVNYVVKHSTKDWKKNETRVAKELMGERIKLRKMLNKGATLNEHHKERQTRRKNFQRKRLEIFHQRMTNNDMRSITRNVWGSKCERLTSKSKQTWKRKIRGIFKEGEQNKMGEIL